MNDLCALLDLFLFFVGGADTCSGHFLHPNRRPNHTDDVYRLIQYPRSKRHIVQPGAAEVVCT